MSPQPVDFEGCFVSGQPPLPQQWSQDVPYLGESFYDGQTSPACNTAETEMWSVPCDEAGPDTLWPAPAPIDEARSAPLTFSVDHDGVPEQVSRTPSPSPEPRPEWGVDTSMSVTPHRSSSQTRPCMDRVRSRSPAPSHIIQTMSHSNALHSAAESAAAVMTPQVMAPSVKWSPDVTPAPGEWSTPAVAPAPAAPAPARERVARSYEKQGVPVAQGPRRPSSPPREVQAAVQQKKWAPAGSSKAASGAAKDKPPSARPASPPAAPPLGVQDWPALGGDARGRRRPSRGPSQPPSRRPNSRGRK